MCLQGPAFYSCSILYFTVSNDSEVDRRYGYVIKSWDFSINAFEGLAGSSTNSNSSSIYLALGKVPFLRTWLPTPQAFWQHHAKPHLVERERETRPQHRELRALLFTNSVWVLSRPPVICKPGLWDGTTCYGPYPRSHVLMKLLQGQHFLLSYVDPEVSTINSDALF